MRKNNAFALILFALAGCFEPQKDYDASARCQGLGLKPGTAEYDTCIRDEKLGRLMEQQRQEFEQRKQQEQDWKMRRF